MMALWPNRDAGNRPMASCFLYSRRQFIALLGGAAAAWPLAACGQNLAQKSHEFLLWHEASTEEAVIYLGADLTKLPSERDA